MILRILPLLIIIVLLPDVYIFMRYIPRIGAIRWLWWIPTFIFLAYTIALSSIRGFLPTDMSVVNWYLFLLGIFVFPKVIFTLFSLLGWGVQSLMHSSRNWGDVIGMVLGISILYIIIYGSTKGFSQINVRQVDYTSSDVPKAFDGYKIVQFSDAHMPSFDHNRDVLANSIDTILQQNADLIVFTGDLQNTHHSEVQRHKAELSRLHAPDGVFSIMGNHDYSDYVKATLSEKKANVEKTMDMQRSLGWKLLNNENIVLHRGNDSIFLAGEENWSLAKHFPRRGSIRETWQGIPEKSFVIMLSHDPTAWKKHILPEVKPQITLSGHTHGAQFSLFGWTPISFAYNEWGGEYYQDNLLLNVSTGFGGNFPFRFGMPREIVVITLHSKN